MKRWCLFILMGVLMISGPLQAKVDLVTLPGRDGVQLTIYNSADLTLVRDRRTLTLKQGENRLQFSWAGTLIDPTSLEILPRDHAGQIHVQDLGYPPRVQNVGVWTIRSDFAGEVPVEISYLTSGLSWRAFYSGTLTPDEKFMRLEGYVRVANHSGEDYENAATRVIVGKVHLVDRIAELARRQYPYGRPVQLLPAETPEARNEGMPLPSPMMLKSAMAGAEREQVKEITKEGLSEYVLYTIEGTETIPDRWSKRLPSFTADMVPVAGLYKFEEEKYGADVIRFISFKNDTDHNLGKTPIPDGTLKVFRAADQSGGLSYEGRSEFKYIPLNEDVELPLGPVSDVVVKPVMMNVMTTLFLFDDKGNIAGWNEVRDYRVSVKNTRGVPVKVDIRRNFNTPDWDIQYSIPGGQYEKVDMDTVKFTLDIPAESEKEFSYSVTTHHGKRAE